MAELQVVTQQRRGGKIDIDQEMPRDTSGVWVLADYIRRAKKLMETGRFFMVGVSDGKRMLYLDMAGGSTRPNGQLTPRKTMLDMSQAQQQRAQKRGEDALFESQGCDAPRMADVLGVG